MNTGVMTSQSRRFQRDAATALLGRASLLSHSDGPRSQAGSVELDAGPDGVVVAEGSEPRIEEPSRDDERLVTEIEDVGHRVAEVACGHLAHP